MEQSVPFWVRHYCRRVLNLDAVGQLEPRDFGVERRTVNRISTHEQQYASWATLAGFLIYVLLFA